MCECLNYIYDFRSVFHRPSWSYGLLQSISYLSIPSSSPPQSKILLGHKNQPIGCLARLNEFPWTALIRGARVLRFCYPRTGDLFCQLLLTEMLRFFSFEGTGARKILRTAREDQRRSNNASTSLHYNPAVILSLPLAAGATTRGYVS